MLEDVRNVLGELPNKTRDKLIVAGNTETVKKGTVLFESNETVDAVFVLRGHAALYRGSRYEDERIIFVAGEGEFLNEIIVINENSSVAAKSLDEMEILRIDRDVLREMMGEDMKLSQVIMASLTRRTRHLYHQAGNANNTYPLERHVAVKINRLIEDYGREEEEGRVLTFPISVTMLSNMLGAKRESVSRVMSKYREANILNIQGGRLVVYNMDELSKARL